MDPVAEESVCQPTSSAPPLGKDISLVRICDYLNSRCCMGVLYLETVVNVLKRQEKFPSTMIDQTPASSMLQARTHFLGLQLLGTMIITVGSNYLQVLHRPMGRSGNKQVRQRRKRLILR